MFSVAWLKVKQLPWKTIRFLFNAAWTFMGGNKMETNMTAKSKTSELLQIIFHLFYFFWLN